MSRHRWRQLAAALLPLVVVAACSGRAPAIAPGVGEHGQVAGAVEQQEPQVALIGLTSDGEVTALDLLTGMRATIAELGSADQAASDGRFVAVSTSSGIAIVDSGVWTVDHGDHSHHYRADPRLAGSLEAKGPVQIASTETVTVVHAQGAAEIRVLDRAALGRGTVVQLGAFASDAVAVQPLGDLLVVADSSGVRLADHNGRSVGELAACTDPRDAITTRVGVVVTCAEGAVLATAPDAPLERVAYPTGIDPDLSATRLSGRTGRPRVAGVAGEAGLWLLDTRRRNWTLVRTSRPLAYVTAVDDTEGHIVALGRTGRILVLGPTGSTHATARTASRSVSVDRSSAIHVNASRAYVSVAPGIVEEIDYADRARIARTFILDGLFVGLVG